MELHLIVAILSLVPKFLQVVGNYVVMVKGEGQKWQIVNFVALWDMVFIISVVIHCLICCQQLNSAFERHTRQLNSLVEHLDVELSRFPPDQQSPPRRAWRTCSLITRRTGRSARRRNGARIP